MLGVDQAHRLDVMTRGAPGDFERLLDDIETEAAGAGPAAASDLRALQLKYDRPGRGLVAGTQPPSARFGCPGGAGSGADCLAAPGRNPLC